MMLTREVRGGSVNGQSMHAINLIWLPHVDQPWSLQGVYIVAECPSLAGTVPEFGPMSRLCPGLPDFAALCWNPARLHWETPPPPLLGGR